MKLLSGADLADFIKERQARQVRALRQADKIFPKLAIVRTNPDPVVDSYMKLKQSYGNDILIDVDVHTIEQSEALDLIDKLNKDKSVHGIIVQLPLPDKSQTDEILNAVDPAKDVDGLGEKSKFDPATPMSINWLLTGYNIDLKNKNILIIGEGRLVGRPLAKMWKNSGLKVTSANRSTKDISKLAVSSDIIVSATGVPGLVKDGFVKKGAVIVDAGVATDKNGLVGDVSPEVYEREDITITPAKGGVGPLTVVALFDNVIRAAKP